MEPEATGPGAIAHASSTPGSVTPGLDVGAPHAAAEPSGSAPPPPPSPVAPPAGTSGRRRFLGWLGGLTVVSTASMVLTPIVGFLLPTSSSAGGNGGKVLVGTTDDIPPGAGKVVAMGSKPAIVVNTNTGVKAYSAICTHLGCVVAWNDLSSQIVCPCHGGIFNPSNGAVVAGPPPTGLPPLSVSVEGNQIFLTES
jgi:cytochrome b6-f complex iron-sulfur subunit